LDPVTTTAGQLVKTAASYSSLSAQAGFAVNGTDSTAARKYDPAQIGAKTLYVGQSESSANQGDLILRRLVIYPSFLSSAQRIAITS
jgi:hypothetical protein